MMVWRMKKLLVVKFAQLVPFGMRRLEKKEPVLRLGVQERLDKLMEYMVENLRRIKLCLASLFSNCIVPLPNCIGFLNWYRCSLAESLDA